MIEDENNKRAEEACQQAKDEKKRLCEKEVRASSLTEETDLQGGRFCCQPHGPDCRGSPQEGGSNRGAMRCNPESPPDQLLAKARELLQAA